MDMDAPPPPEPIHIKDQSPELPWVSDMRVFEISISALEA
jgi:hypothetical protein